MTTCSQYCLCQWHPPSITYFRKVLTCIINIITLKEHSQSERALLLMNSGSSSTLNRRTAMNPAFWAFLTLRTLLHCPDPITTKGFFFFAEGPLVRGLHALRGSAMCNFPRNPWFGTVRPADIWKCCVEKWLQSWRFYIEEKSNKKL